MTRKMNNGRCECGQLFIGMDKWEYNWSVMRHIREEHSGEDATQLMDRL